MHRGRAQNVTEYGLLIASIPMMVLLGVIEQAGLTRRVTRLIPILVGVLALVGTTGSYALVTTRPPISNVSRSPSGLPFCDGRNGRPAHDLHQWHGLVAHAADGSVLCTYGHTHGSNPNDPVVANIFGPLPASLNGQTVSYPWATGSKIADGDYSENCDWLSTDPLCAGTTSNKHAQYQWIIRDFGNCAPWNGQGSPTQVTAFRVELHADGSLGATVRFHSFFGQYRVEDCTTGQVGYWTGGGHVDYAILLADDNLVPLPVPSGQAPSDCILQNDHRQEGNANDTSGEAGNDVWYGNANRANAGYNPNGNCDDVAGDLSWDVQVNVGRDMFGPVDPANPTQILLDSYREGHKQTSVGTDTMSVIIPFGSNYTGTGKSTSDGKILWYTANGTQTGTDCGAVGPECIPWTATNIPGPGGSNFGIPPNNGAGTDADVPGPNGQPGWYVSDPVTGSTSATATPVATPTPHPTRTRSPRVL
jgi:hypothetical protein